MGAREILAKPKKSMECQVNRYPTYTPPSPPLLFLYPPFPKYHNTLGKSACWACLSGRGRRGWNGYLTSPTESVGRCGIPRNNPTSWEIPGAGLGGNRDDHRRLHQQMHADHSPPSKTRAFSRIVTHDTTKNKRNEASWAHAVIPPNSTALIARVLTPPGGVGLSSTHSITHTLPYLRTVPLYSLLLVNLIALEVAVSRSRESYCCYVQPSGRLRPRAKSCDPSHDIGT